jgi:hypothetical protein
MEIPPRCTTEVSRGFAMHSEDFSRGDQDHGALRLPCASSINCSRLAPPAKPEGSE